MCVTQHYCPASMFAWLSPHKHFPLWSPPSGPLRPSPHSQEQTLPWDYFSIFMLQRPAAALSKWLGSLSGVCMATASIVCMIIIPFRLSQISCFTFQQPQMLHLCHKQLPLCRTLTPASVLPPCMCRSSPVHSLFFTFLPLSCRVLCGSIHSFPVVRYSWWLSVGVLRDLLCL